MKKGEIWRPRDKEVDKLFKHFDNDMGKIIKSMRVIILSVEDDKISYAYYRKGLLKSPSNKNYCNRARFLLRFQKEYEDK